MTIGDVVEWVAGGLLTAAAWSAGGLAAGLGAAAVFCFYEAQVLAGDEIPKLPNLRFWRKRSKKVDMLP